LIVPLLFFSCQTNRATTSNGRHTNWKPKSFSLFITSNANSLL
jgi:hypothetical protein